MFAMSWAIEDGRAGEIALAGQRVVLVGRYDDDEAGSPWEFLLYIDESADDPQREALTEIFLGHTGGTPLQQFPWAFKPSRLIEVRTARIELDHAPRRGWFWVGSEVEVRVRGPAQDQEPVTCLIPGHDRAGREIVADTLEVSDDPLIFEFAGSCGYEATFDYSSAD